MAGARLSMRKTREILRHKWALGHSHREVARALGVSMGAITAAVTRAGAAGLDWTAIEALSEITPAMARVRRDGAETEVPVEALRVGDIVVVKTTIVWGVFRLIGVSHGVALATGVAVAQVGECRLEAAIGREFRLRPCFLLAYSRFHWLALCSN